MEDIHMGFVIGILGALIGSVFTLAMMSLMFASKEEEINLIPTNIMGLEDYVELYKRKGITTKIENGKVVGFERE